MFHWSKDEIAMEILGLYANGEAINYSNIAQEHPTLLRAACRHFGSWRSAVEFAGLSYEDVRKYHVWTKTRIINRIKELYHQNVDLSWRNISTHVDPQLAAAATKPSRFGSWRAAIEAADLNYDEIRRYRDWDEEAILEQMRALADSGRPLNSKEAQENNIDLFAAAIRRYASWDQALAAAGLNAGEIRRRPPFQRRQSPVAGS